MSQKLGKSTRIAVAKRSLKQLIEGSLPEGLPVAMRTFKAGKGSCATRLAVPLGPLDRADLLDLIERLKINKGTKTPLASAIAAVAGDIGDVTGPRIVVVVTDGAETCDGDPGAAVQSLVDAGFDTTVNIVGFALKDEQLKQDMAAWAAAGGGVFADAQDQSGLSAAIAETLRAPFRVYDETGAIVGEGIVGSDAIPVPMGTYRVEVLADPEPIVFDGVRVGTGETVHLEVGGQEP
jgi:Ca-activated chloride channel family protein